MKLNSVGAILLEMQRAYREARAGRLALEDLTRVIFALEKIRIVVEAVQTIEGTAGKSGPYVTAVNIHGVPHGTFLPVDGAPVLEHQPEDLTPAPPPPRPFFTMLDGTPSDPAPTPRTVPRGRVVIIPNAIPEEVD